ncbi:MAG: hypothetical protein FWB86_05510 [Treponema sp.]|nr:hypothetical protein [Treponema sp.]MCL2250537.1 hypothetical protein [Treponema sp.]
MGKIIQVIKDWFLALTAVQKRQLALLCTGVFTLFLTLAVLISLSARKTEKPAEIERTEIISPIPAGELLLPDEPDFVPGVLLERDRKTSWTQEDAELFWQDPLRQGEEQWREKIEIEIDKILERVP